MTSQPTPSDSYKYRPAFCRLLPYFDRSLLSMGWVLHQQGFRSPISSYGIAWGFGHPTWLLDFDNDRIVCTRCGKVKEPTWMQGGNERLKSMDRTIDTRIRFWRNR